MSTGSIFNKKLKKIHRNDVKSSRWGKMIPFTVLKDCPKQSGTGSASAKRNICDLYVACARVAVNCERCGKESKSTLFTSFIFLYINFPQKDNLKELAASWAEDKRYCKRVWNGDECWGGRFLVSSPHLGRRRGIYTNTHLRTHTHINIHNSQCSQLKRWLIFTPGEHFAVL